MSAHGSIIETSVRARQFHPQEPVRAAAGVGLAALAVMLRFEGLTRQSLWADEGNSWGMALRSLSEIGPAAAGDIHPPLYYYLLNLWCRLFGTTEAGMRSLSAVFGCLTVLVVYLWARRLAGGWAAVGAGSLAAISPFAVYYSQEARAYALVALLTALSCWTLTEYMRASSEGGRPRRWLLAYVLAAAALLWSHYLGLAVVGLHNSVLLFWLWRRQDGREALLRQWLLAQAAVLLLFLPWLPRLFGSAGDWPAISTREPIGFYLQEMVRLYGEGPGAMDVSTWSVLALVPALLGAALWLLQGRRRTLWALVALAAVWPGLALWLLSLLRPAYRAKFLLLGLPAYHVLAGAGMAGLATWVGRRTGWAAGLMVGLLLGALTVPAAVTGLEGYRSGRTAVRDDYRGLSAFLTAAAGPEAAIVLNAPGQVEVFDYYYAGPAAVYPLPKDRPPDAVALESALSDIAARHPRVYSVIWATAESDPAGVMERWLDTQAHKALDVWYGNVRLTLHETPAVLPEPRDTHALFGDVVAIESYSLSDRPARPGEAVPIELTWRLGGALSHDVVLFIQLLDERSSIVGQRDTLPVSGHYPATQWVADVPVLDRQAVPVLLGTPPGTYTVVAGLYDPATGIRLTLPDGSDRLQLGTVEVLAASAPLEDAALLVSQRQQVGLGPLRLVAWDVAPLGGDSAALVELAAGAPLSLVFYWRVVEPTALQLEFVFEGPGGERRIGQAPALSQALSVERWETSHTYRDPHILFLPGDLAPGEYRLSVIASTDVGQGQVDLGRVAIR